MTSVSYTAERFCKREDVFNGDDRRVGQQITDVKRIFVVSWINQEYVVVRSNEYFFSFLFRSTFFFWISLFIFRSSMTLPLSTRSTAGSGARLPNFHNGIFNCAGQGNPDSYGKYLEHLIAGRFGNSALSFLYIPQNDRRRAENPSDFSCVLEGGGLLYAVGNRQVA